ncbi:uncharacterized protein MONBRDRAFT_27156 [Monosiga brevicollis MX1]|uniref:Uncharacterized protein n=1 Tax=Monosiga brevicollis TaxID=81824 RepID=A9V4H0_MONBE|nr:uncharacterized protein MONBRDRAFT_27156 [Monosiga brevicollis MX1]EDQ87708.1 predicted protein [Monosiga brevicollis MX1]|eukprot:XP_001747628.1 hypothetical protein [Monosiga brevicollis MX1]
MAMTITSVSQPTDSPVPVHFGSAQSKRCRYFTPPDASYHATTSPTSKMACAQRGPVKRRQSDDLDTDSDGEEDTFTPQEPLFKPRSQAQPASSYLPLELRRRAYRASTHSPVSSPSAAASHSTAGLVPKAVPKPTPIVLTLEQVESMIEKAVKDREEQLAQEYNSLLAEKLQVIPYFTALIEQFNQFHKFNEDFIHRRMEESTFSYMS